MGCPRSTACCFVCVRVCACACVCVCVRVWQEEFLAHWQQSKLDALLCPPNALPAFIHGSSADLTPACSYTFIFNLLHYVSGTSLRVCVCVCAPWRLVLCASRSRPTVLAFSVRCTTCGLASCSLWGYLVVVGVVVVVGVGVFGWWCWRYVPFSCLLF